MSKRRFSPEDWLDLGLRALSEKGAEAVKLEAICAEAGLTRGSFYYHFADHEAFLVALAERWHDTETRAIAATLPGLEDADARAAALDAAAAGIDYRLELGIRELARRVAPVDAVLRRADAQRLDILTDLMTARFGLDAKEAEALAFLEYAAFSGMILLDPAMPKDRQAALSAVHQQMLTRFAQKPLEEDP